LALFMAVADESADGRRKPLGAYGLRLEGIPGADSLLLPADPRWPRLAVTQQPGRSTTRGGDVCTDTHARLQLQNGGEIVIDRHAGRAMFVVPRPLRGEELIHPYMAPVAAVFSYWLGRESFHAAAFIHDGGVWAVLGDRESGKSSTLAWLALRGQPVVSDDMLILDGMTAFAAPRSIDLRPEAARELGAGEPMGVVGTRERWRLKVEPVDSGMPLRGWIFLAWGAHLEIERLPASRRVALLAAQRGVRLPPLSATSLLDLSALPAWQLTRPQGWGSVGLAAERLLKNISR
jgi:hypothetical protein